MRRFGERIRQLLQRPGASDLSKYLPVVDAAGEREASLRELPSSELVAIARGTGPRLFERAGVAEFCAVAREIARRILGERPFDTQLQGTAALLDGYVVEMATGEGKTLSGALAAIGFAMQGRRVHVVSVNDYLARRDAEWMGDLYAAFGVSVGCVEQHTEPADRRAAYAGEVTYVSVGEVGFDVLRDRLRTDPADALLPAPDVVIVDEADSVLIDEATVPLVLAGEADRGYGDPDIARIVSGLSEIDHYDIDDERRNVYLTDAGIDHIEALLGGLDLHTVEHSEVLTRVQLALHAHALLRRDVDYIVRDGTVELISIARGRVARRQRWPDGLQAAVEAKEGLAISPAGEILDSILVQALIGRYRTICGMSGTAVAVADQLAEFYRLETGRIPTNVPCVRVDEPDRVYATVAQKQRAIVDYVRMIHATGRPVLLGTTSVVESEEIAGKLARAGIEGVVLNAKNDAEEAAIVSRAGEYGRVTISTQMAGRGTDIRLGSPDGTDRSRVSALGGLCVIGSGRYHTGRLDEQLRGRAGRQGDPGSSVLFTSPEDDLFTRYVQDASAADAPDADGRLRSPGIQRMIEHAQRVAEGEHLSIHRNSWRYHHLVTLQRDAVLAHRDEVLRGDPAARRLRELCPRRSERITAAVSERVLAEASRAIVLAHLDRWWSEHLAFLADVREGIHLRAIGRQTPIDEFHRTAVTAFAEFLPEVYRRAADTFTEAEITSEGVDLESHGLTRPSSTWTYMINDHPLGGAGEGRVLNFLGGMVRDGATKIGMRNRAVVPGSGRSGR